MLASSKRTFFTTIFCTNFGKNFSNFLVVIQKEALVLRASDLYFVESKNEISFFCAKCKGFTSFTIKSLLILRLGNNFLNLYFFFEKKIF